MAVRDCCPACRSTATGFDRRFDFKGRAYTLRICNHCGSRFYEQTLIPDYTSHTASEASLRDYVEHNANIELLAGRLVQIIVDTPHGKLLDIGCGYGFSADAVRRLTGWKVLGIEPSTYGRHGAAALGVPMLHEFIDASHPVARERFELIFASEVIEHMDDPVEALRFWASMLTDDGVIALTTPDSQSLDNSELSHSDKLAKLSPGSHVLLFSKAGLERAFGLAGLPFSSINVVSGSLVATASRSPLRPYSTEQSTDEIGERYMRAAIDAGISDPMLNKGLRFRLMQNLARRGRFAEAAEHAELLPDISVPTAPIRSYEDFLQRLPAFAPALAFWRGMIALNQSLDYAHARQLFAASTELCLLKLRAVPSAAVVEADLLGMSLYHAALSAERAGDLEWARCGYAAMTNLGNAFGCKRHTHLEAQSYLSLAALGRPRNVARNVYALSRRMAGAVVNRMRAAR